MEQKTLDRLRCVVERITYQSDGYSVLKCAAKGYNDLVAVVGMMPNAHVGSVLTLGDHWKIDSKYGRQFEVIITAIDRLNWYTAKEPLFFNEAYFLKAKFIEMWLKRRVAYGIQN